MGPRDGKETQFKAKYAIGETDRQAPYEGVDNALASFVISSDPGADSRS